MRLPIPTLTRKALARFWASVDKSDGCWVTTSRLNKLGYGNFWYDGRTYLAHRISYALANGSTPQDMLVCHSCDNPSCVNPDHLWLGTDQDNIRDRSQKGRDASLKGETNPRAILTEQQVREIRQDKRPSTILSIEYGVSSSTIKNAKTGRSWGYLS